MIKRIIALSVSIMMLAGIMLPAAYAADGTQTPELTVVGKRIIDDDKYFEISLEVNGDYEDYSSVGVVLKYDPNIIVPTTWDEEAVPVDMSQSTDWASRRALPTLGKDTWTTHTALTYITQEDGKDVGYLYLGAEYPGILPNDSDSSVTPDPNATPAPTPTVDPAATPEPTIDPDADPHTNPVVVARFMYKDDTSQNTIVQKWTSAWDADWTKNEILTVAPDAISDASPAQFGFAIYDADFSMKAFQFDYTNTILEADEQAAQTDAEIVLGYGESAQAGGLSLNDIYVVLFYDWDDSLLGTFTCGVGEDSSADINEYIKTKFIHPELQNNANLTSTERVDNYRGEYPSAGPNATNPTIPGGTGTFPDTFEQIDTATGEKITVENPDAGTKYPLTNKLEYCFAGRSFNTDKDGNALPFVGGWTKVAAATMEDTWTALDDVTNFKQTVDVDGDEVADVNADGKLVDADGNVIDMVSLNFANITQDDLENGTMMVKAVYVPGTKLDSGNDRNYTAVGPMTYGLIKTGVYFVDYEYRRLNASGCGVTRMPNLSVQMDLTQVGASSSTALEVVIKNGEIIPVSLTPTSAVNTVGYQLKDTSTSNYVAGAEKSSLNGLTDGEPIKLQGPEGLVFRINAEEYLDQAYQWASTGSAISQWAVAVFNTTLKLSQDTAGKNVAAGKRSAMTQAITDCVAGAIAAGVNYKELTWYQLQYAMLNTSDPYVTNDVAKAFCEQYSALMDKING